MPRLVLVVLIAGVFSACGPDEASTTTGMDIPCAFPGGSLDGTIHNSWSENARIACDTCREIPPPDEFTANLLVLLPDGSFTYTYTVFLETNIDYAGSYEWDANDGTIVFTIDGKPPPGFDGEGTYNFTSDGRLILRDIWLSDEIESCGYEFLPLAHSPA